MLRRVTLFIAAYVVVGCTPLRPATVASTSKDCYVESGWVDSSNGCSIRAGYPDCYLVCPDQGTRKRL
jgi:hypothetical protein